MDCSGRSGTTSPTLQWARSSPAAAVATLRGGARRSRAHTRARHDDRRRARRVVGVRARPRRHPTYGGTAPAGTLVRRRGARPARRGARGRSGPEPRTHLGRRRPRRTGTRRSSERGQSALGGPPVRRRRRRRPVLHARGPRARAPERRGPARRARARSRRHRPAGRRRARPPTGLRWPTEPGGPHQRPGPGQVQRPRPRPEGAEPRAARGGVGGAAGVDAGDLPVRAR